MNAALAKPPVRLPQSASMQGRTPPDLHLPGVGADGDGLTVPGSALAEFEAFRAWKLSDACPAWGKFEWIGNRPRLEVMPESLFTHGTTKTDIVRVLGNLIAEQELGFAFTDSTSVVSPDGAERRTLCEPDFVFLSHEAITDGRVTLTPKVGREGDFTEIVGPPEVVIEVRSDSSTRKDTVELPGDLFALGVREYWLADARTDPPGLLIHARGEDGFEPIAADDDGFAVSATFGRRYRLETQTSRSGIRQTRLIEAPAN
ncbi:Uma2 family endonuclease [Alienimonas chondri]|uniref:Putative restriction endonuclease domain-containing protein n=1 Tax=Alienimonas chondri TaxID=2681879 RepID=A0ABX1V9G2_9PLAN|nr:Uma2 family endonuclease [Alienimonas chondri]NNJ24155.1 hypothetical protein [Alienimonas chondri]